VVNAAARTILGDHVNQAGAKKTTEKAHLDITHYASLGPEEVEAIEREANRLVQEDIQLRLSFMARSDAEQTYGMRLYQGGAVPGNEIRVVDIEGIDVEACGGTHVNHTGEIGTIMIQKTQKIQDSVVRITFTAGQATQNVLAAQQQAVDQAATLLGVAPDQLPGRVEELLAKLRALLKVKAKGEYDETDTVLASASVFEGKPAERLADLLEVPPERITEKLEKVYSDYNELVSLAHEIAQHTGPDAIEATLESASKVVGPAGAATLVLKVLPDFDRKIVANYATNVQKRTPDAIVVVVSQGPRGSNVYAFTGPKTAEATGTSYDMKGLLTQTLARHHPKGGGKPDAASVFIASPGSIAEDLLLELKSALTA
jgi:alanyl-tRNA synthetase